MIELNNFFDSFIGTNARIAPSLRRDFACIRGRGEKMIFFRHVVLGAILLIMLVMATAVHAQSPYDDVLVAQGLRNLQAENYDEALANFKTAWEKGTKTSAKAYYLGMTNYRLTNYSEAIHFLERAIYLDPANNEARLNWPPSTWL